MNNFSKQFFLDTKVLTLSREVGLWESWILVSDGAASVKRIEDSIMEFHWLIFLFEVHEWKMHREENENMYLRWVLMTKWDLVKVECKI